MDGPKERRIFFKDPEEGDRQGINPFVVLPDEMLVLIFSELDVNGWNNLSFTDRRLQRLSKKPEVLASLLGKSPEIPLAKRLELAKRAAHFLTKLDLNHLSLDKCLELEKRADRFRTQLYLHKLTDQELEEILLACPNIKELNLSDSGVTNAFIGHLPKNLKKLDLSRCRNMTEAGIAKLPQSLHELNLTGWYKLTDGAIDNLPRGLQDLILSGCWSLTDAGIANLPQSLHSLDLNRCDGVTEVGIANLPRDLQGLSVYDKLWRMRFTRQIYKKK